MDRSDDLSRSRRFTALELGSTRSRPKIVTSRDERVAPLSAAPTNRAPQPSLEFRARQRLRTYAEAATVLDRQAPRDASTAKRSTPPPSNRMPNSGSASDTASYGTVIPEPPSPMAEAYVGRTPQLTQREAEFHNLEPAHELVVPTADPVADEDISPLEAPITAATAETAGPIETVEAVRDTAEFAPAPQDDHGFDQTTAENDPSVDPEVFQSATVHPATDPRARTDGTGESPAAFVGKYVSKSALVAKSLVAKADSMWQNITQRGKGLIAKGLALPNVTAQSGVGVIGRVSHLPANSLLTPQMGSLAASARADAAHARPDANVRPVKSDGVLNQEPEPRRTLLARKIQDNVERTEARAETPAGPITQTKRGRMAFSSLSLIVVTLVLLAAAAWATISIMQRTSTPITTIGETERYRIEAVLDALFIDPGTVDGVIDGRTTAAITEYATEYGYTGPQEISATLLQHLEDEAEAMGVLDLIQ